MPSEDEITQVPRLAHIADIIECKVNIARGNRHNRILLETAMAQELIDLLRGKKSEPVPSIGAVPSVRNPRRRF